jgi:hypothetical protein
MQIDPRDRFDKVADGLVKQDSGGLRAQQSGGWTAGDSMGDL